MDRQTIRLNKKAIEEFLRENIKNEMDISNELDDSIVNVILQMIPIMGHYEEEGQRLNFKLVVGMEDSIDRCHVLHTYEMNKGDDINDRVKRINKMIKDVAIFGNQYANILLVQRKQTVKCGIYFPNILATIGNDKEFLDKGYVIIEYLYKNKVVIKARNDKRIYVCLDFNEEIPMELFDLDKNEFSEKCRRWEGIFDKIKRNVHGTICLIVDKKWDGDDNLSKYEPLNIHIGLPDEPSSGTVRDFNNIFNIFITMLNYDGITVIDTEENIRAYNLFCKINNKEQINGGARHYAYESLKKNRKQYYKAIYFQSQEGEIKFYNFDSEKEQTFFDASIMRDEVEYKGYVDSEEIKEQYTKIKEIEENEEKKVAKSDVETYRVLRELTSRLKCVHEGVDNFYNEPESVMALRDEIKNSASVVFNTLMGNYPDLRRNLLNTVFKCIIGNLGGYSWYAQKDLKEIMNIISDDVYIKYFENAEYLDVDLLWAISIKKINQRWNQEILLKIKEKNQHIHIIEEFEKKKYSESAYKKMYNIVKKCTKY